MTEQRTADTPKDGITLKLAIIAAVASIGLTAAAFWLSYEHLHDVAHAHGLSDAARAWAWPATVDLFIGIGEVLMLRGSLAGRIDPWSIALTAVGSAGSIALNVAGVGKDAAGMDYVVAAVPPVAALLAFGALMRQIHGALEHRLKAQGGATEAPHQAVWTATETVPVAPRQQPAERYETAVRAATESAIEDAPVAPQPTAPERHEDATETAPKAPRTTPRKAPAGRHKPGSRDAAKNAIEALYKALGRRPLESEMVTELKRIKAKFSSRQFANKLRTEIETDRPDLAALGTDNVRPLTGS